MSNNLFVPQSTLDAWSDAGIVEVTAEALTIVAEKRTYRLTPAVRFLRVEGQASDPHGLLLRVKTEAALKQMGAEHLLTSVILGDVAYTVTPGFLAVAGSR